MLFQDKQQYSVVAQANILNSLSQVLFETVDILSFGSFENVHVCPKTNKMNTHGRINPPRIAAPFEPAGIFFRVVLDKRWKCFKRLKFQVPPIDMHITAFPSVTQNRKNEIRNWVKGAETDGTFLRGGTNFDLSGYHQSGTTWVLNSM